ncbi:MAG: response regulator [Myxococcales bacterium]|nr:response regulator [Myxococcales bacterium]
MVTFTTQDVAKVLSASRTSVQRWIDSGSLRAFKTPGGHRRVTQRELVAFLRRQGAPVPSSLLLRVRLLVVDDDAHFLKALKPLMKALSSSVEVDTVDNGVDALLKIGAGEVDAVLLDATMPNLDGMQVLEKLKGNQGTAEVVVLAMSGRGDDKLEQKLLKGGAAKFLVKPITPKAIFDALHELGMVDAPDEAVA